MLHIYLMLTPGVLMLDYAGPAEALRMARDMGAPLSLYTCGPQAKIHTSLGTHLSGVQALPQRLPENSLVMVVGNSQEREDYATPAGQQLVNWLRTVPISPTRLASICSGALLLAMAGHLRGRRCTTHHSLINDLRALEPGATVLDNRVFVEDGPVLTSAGITTGIDLALHIIEQLAGPELASRVARRLVLYLRRGPDDAQLSPWLAQRNHLHPAVHRAQDHIVATLTRDPSQSCTLTQLAHVACVSPRHLTRLFMQHTGMSVVDCVRGMRLARVQEMQKHQPQLPQEQLALACGFGSVRGLRRALAAGPPHLIRPR